MPKPDKGITRQENYRSTYFVNTDTIPQHQPYASKPNLGSTLKKKKTTTNSAIHHINRINEGKKKTTHVIISIDAKKHWTKSNVLLDFPGGPVVKNLPAKAADLGLIPGPGRSHMLWGN